MVSTILEYPDIQKHMYSSEDFEEITSAGFTLSEQDNYFTVEIKGKQKIFIPKSIRRAIFWATHFPLHTGIRLTLNSLREKVFYWPKLEEDIQKFLSQCVCATKKTDKFKRKPHGQGICATHVLQICAIDLYEYNSEHYFTLIDLFSKFLFCTKIASEEASEVKLAYDKFCSSYATPESLFSDNGKEFALIETERNTTSANFPRPNGKIERFHRELGKLSRIHDTTPDNAVNLLQTTAKKAIFLGGLKLKFQPSDMGSMNLISSKPEKIQIYKFVYREIQQRKRAKHQNTYTGPHMIIKTIGSTSYVINSDKNYAGEIKVHYDHLKPFVIPSTEGWSVNMKYLKPALNSLGLNIFQGINVHIDFKNLSLLTLQLL